MFHHVRSATVAQHVRAGVRIALLHQRPHGLAGQAVAARGKKNFLRVRMAQQGGSASLQISFNRIERCASQRNNALFISLTSH